MSRAVPSVTEADPLGAALRGAPMGAEALAEVFLARCAEREPLVGAWAWLDPDQLRAAANAAAAQPRRGPLHGLPVGVKDVIDTVDMPTAYGSPIYAGHRPAADAACVALLRRTGAVVMGKTETTEFAALAPARTVNPHHPAHTPGGSSSGSAAAVADGMVWAALGTQTGGSIIRPASFCGCVGYKPTFGTINTAGLKPFSASTDTIGVFTARVRDAAWLVSELVGWPGLRSRTAPARPPRLALCRTVQADLATPAAHAGLESAAALARKAGAQVTDCELPAGCDALWAAGMTILTAEAQQAFAFELETRPELLSTTLRELLGGEPVPRADYLAAQRVALECRQAVREMFGQYDAVLTFSSTGEAPLGLASTGSAVFNHPWSLLHLPCVNIPGLVGPTGLPIGVQLVGAWQADASLLAHAGWLEDVLRKDVGGGTTWQKR